MKATTSSTSSGGNSLLPSRISSSSPSEKHVDGSWDHLWQTSAFNDPELYQLYILHQRSSYDTLSSIPQIIMFYGAAITRFSFGNLGKDGPLFSAAFVILAVGSVFFIVFMISRLMVLHTPKRRQRSRLYGICARCLRFCHRGRVEDIIGILGTSAAGMYLVARVWAGQCPNMSNVWDSQRCNPYADVGSIPHDQVILLYLIPIITQSVVRGISLKGVIFCWMLSLGFVITSSAHVNGVMDVWMILYSIIFLNISAMVERLTRETFIQSQGMLAANTLRSKHEFDLLELSTENERQLREKEIFQLRSLMGNVAHDLKTPLHSIEADLEVLSIFISKIPTSEMMVANAEFRSKGLGDNFRIQSIFDSLNATCKFMAMAINRSQDFMKASNNIALVPVMETFELAPALAMSVTCMNHLQSTRLITVHPLDPQICPHVISDMHWLRENALCLLSNAIKYSHEGIVDVRIQLIDDTRPVPNYALAPHPATSPSKSRIDEMGNDLFQSRTFNPDSHVVTMPMHGELFQESYLTSHLEVRQMLLFTVEDTGIGITQEASKNLFQPFQQAQRMAGGTGLGLFSLSKRIEALGGSTGVAARSDGEQGSMFWFTFPYRPDEAARADAIPEPAAGVYLNLQSLAVIEPKCILIIDDSLSILKVTSRLLTMNGHATRTAPNGSVGLKMLKDAFLCADFDMVLTDLQMPVMDGIEATRRFREFEAEEIKKEMSDLSVTPKRKRKRILIVGMSASTDTLTKQEGLNSGMDYFLAKPFSYKDLQPILLNAPHFVH